MTEPGRPSEGVAPTTASAAADGLLHAFGSELIQVDAHDRAPFERDWRGRTAASACAVALPRDVATVQALVRHCRAHGIAIVPQGGNTGLCGGSVPFPGESRPQLILSLSRLNRVRAIDLGNDTVTVEAGCTLQAIQELAEAHGRLFPLSLAAEGTCQIGGNLSTNAGGVQVLRYGNMRALALGLEVVLPDGQLWQGLRGLRKDNTGYDLKQLFIGAEGTLGLITAATLRLFPRPRSQGVAWIGLASPASALALFQALRGHFGERISSFELISRLPLAFALRHLPDTREPLAAAHDWQVLLQVDEVDARGLAEGLEALMEDAACAELILDAVIAQSEAQSRTLWNLREHLSEAQRLEGPSLKHDISLPISAIPSFIDQAAETLTRIDPGLRIVCFGHMGDGNLHYNLFPSVPMQAGAPTSTQSELSRAVHDLVAGLGGSFSAEHGVGQFKVAELARYADPVALALMRSLKQAWDPQGVMNPGKILAP